MEARFRENSEAPGRGPGAAQWRSVALAAGGSATVCHGGRASLARQAATVPLAVTGTLPPSLLAAALPSRLVPV